MVSISYAVTVYNEIEEIQKLITYLKSKIRDEDEICILFDKKNGTEEVDNYLKSEKNINVNPSFAFNNHFADWKNLLTARCTKDFVFQIDADELPNSNLVDTLPTILERNEVDVLLVPRVNIVDGLTEDHIKKWGWRLTNGNWINWPDYQWRIYKNELERIKWVNRVHERLTGFDKYATLPDSREYSLYHRKDISRQEKQNEFYSTLM